MSAQLYFVTGSDTGVGKTVLTALLVGHLRKRGTAAAGLKPLSSGGRGDARILCAAAQGALELDEVNPWHFRTPLAPWLAARRERKGVQLADVIAQIRSLQERFDVLLIEGAGGLLSPLGEQFNARDLIARLNATPLVVCPNRLGAINQTLLVLRALPRQTGRRTQVVLVSQGRENTATRANRKALAALLGGSRVHLLPRLSD